MTGIETQVLRVIQELGRAGQDAIARKIGVSEGYAFNICRHLAEDGYVVNSHDAKFKLTEKSMRELSPVRSRGPIAVLKGGM
ncbi:winged helix-turn-helix transcriptional regulator [Acidobacteria bacterium AH-259-G07]|nr:winged helix-turn-helix transcriptional regulator [Acidobacteria bacterium AH-259-G07]